jgi:hypothetical protein
MSEPVALRVLEIGPGEWICQFAGGLNGWVQLGYTFDNEADARAFMQEQLDSADYDAE